MLRITTALLVAASAVASVSSFRVGPRMVAPSRSAFCARSPIVRCADTQTEASEPQTFADFTDEQGSELPLVAKEKLFLDSIAAFYNDESAVLGDDAYERLKLDLEFSASKYVTMSKDELKFVIASSRYREGKPIMSDDEYDMLRKELKKKNSAAVIHDAPTCKVDSGICKSDCSPDQGKNAILYLPGTLAATVLWTELLYWTQRMDPFIAAVLGSPLIYVAARLVTEKILFQNPLIVTTTCPNCQSVVNLYFGDVLGVNNENMMATVHDCPVCKTTLKGNRETMVVETDLPKN
mmetsp:Transcript_8167/g.22461  ORF Transcript_8167/g.22461 Transcript_8167/m.22461 type:complete len:294 (-) Transcript_8167:283-1164(-)